MVLPFKINPARAGLSSPRGHRRSAPGSGDAAAAAGRTDDPGARLAGSAGELPRGEHARTTALRARPRCVVSRCASCEPCGKSVEVAIIYWFSLLRLTHTHIQTHTQQAHRELSPFRFHTPDRPSAHVGTLRVDPSSRVMGVSRGYLAVASLLPDLVEVL